MGGQKTVKPAPIFTTLGWGVTQIWRASVPLALKGGSIKKSVMKARDALVRGDGMKTYLGELAVEGCNVVGVKKDGNQVRG